MRNTWAVPSRFQAGGKAIRSGFWLGFEILGPVGFCSRACTPCRRLADNQPLKIQSGLFGEVQG